MADKAYKLVKQLNNLLWKWEDGVEKVFRIDGPIRVGRAQTNPRNGINKAPDILSVTDVTDGATKEILVGQVLKSTLTENYPDDGYIGKTFACLQGPPPDGKRYKTMVVNEVEVEVPTTDKSKKK